MRWAPNLLLLAASLLFAAGAFEIALRIRFARTMDFAMEMWKYAVALKRPVDDPELRFVHAPGRSAFLMGAEVATNSAGFRDREFPRAKPPGVFRIVLLGDSTTLGWGVPADQTVAKQLEARLNASGRRRFEVINCGVGNYGTVQEAAHFRAFGAHYQPSLVLLQYFINDAEPPPEERSYALLGRSYLIAFSASRWDAIQRFSGKRPGWREYYAGLYGADRPGWRAAQAALRSLAASTRAAGVPFAVAILPELHQLQPYPFEREHALVRAVLDSERVPALDLTSALRGRAPEPELWVHPQDPHPNGRANAIVAEAVERWLAALIPAS